MNKLSIGMSKAEVIETLGTPNSTAANEHVEFLIYRKMAAVVSDWPRDYFVKLQDGKVVAYGKKGDFDSTKDPALNLNVTDNSKSQ